MEKINIETEYISRLADLDTPVSMYLKLREHFMHVFLLESTEIHDQSNHLSFIGVNILSEIVVQNYQTELILPKQTFVQQVDQSSTVSDHLHQFINLFSFKGAESYQQYNGLFGHSNYRAVQYLEQIQIHQKKDMDIPDMRYSIFEFLIIYDHLKNEIIILHNRLKQTTNSLERINQILDHTPINQYTFTKRGEVIHSMTDEDFEGMVVKAKQHCAIGDVFQMVLSRRYTQPYSGDDFSVYRSLRNVNPSPYLFYFDYGSYRLMGSSPEAQLVIRNNKAFLHPIAGTYRRTGDADNDSRLAQELLSDPKENAEHVMLVDLARNDLNRSTENVQVAELKKIKMFSHVIHMASKVEGTMHDKSPFKVFSDTFPAGTLTGAPKHKAMSLIDRYEKSCRGFYGGAIGYFNPIGGLNHAIMIRSILSKDNQLHYQAGAGIVIDSDEKKECQEIKNKLAAIDRAIRNAENI
jgi:anthranilate synthase component 1